MERSGIPPNSIFVDTSGWADPVLSNTADHAAMIAFYKQIIADERPLVTTNYIITELVALLTTRSRAPRSRVFDLVNSMQTMPQLRIVHIDVVLHRAAWEMLQQYADKPWSLVDASSFVVMRGSGITEAFTSDQHFAQAGFVRVPHL